MSHVIIHSYKGQVLPNIEAPLSQRSGFFRRPLHHAISWSLISLATTMFVSYTTLAYTDMVNSEYIPMAGEIQGVQIVARRSAATHSSVRFVRVESVSEGWFGWREITLQDSTRKPIPITKGFASSFFEQNVAAFAIDGNVETAWVAESKEDSVTIELEKPQELSAVRLFPKLYVNPSKPATHKLLTSTDGKDYKLLTTFQGEFPDNVWLEWVKQ